MLKVTGSPTRAFGDDGLFMIFKNHRLPRAGGDPAALRNLRDPVFMSNMTRTKLTATIRDGLPNTSMPAWKSVLSAEEIAAIVAYVAKAFHPLPE